jgi:hypothetical protein
MSLEDMEREDEALANFDIGFQAHLDGEPMNESEGDGWKRGWQEAALSAETE